MYLVRHLSTINTEWEKREHVEGTLGEAGANFCGFPSTRAHGDDKAKDHQLGPGKSQKKRCVPLDLFTQMQTLTGARTRITSIGKGPSPKRRRQEFLTAQVVKGLDHSLRKRSRKGRVAAIYVKKRRGTNASKRMGDAGDNEEGETSTG